MTTIRTVLKRNNFDATLLNYWADKGKKTIIDGLSCETHDNMGELKFHDKLIDIEFPIKKKLCTSVMAENADGSILTVDTGTGKTSLIT